LTEVLVAGNTSGGTNIELSTTDKVQFRDAAIYINSSVDGQLDIVADTEIQIAATTVDINGAVDVSGTLGVTGVATLASLVATTADINAGTIDNTVIGGTTAAAISGTTGQFATSLNVDGTVTADGLTVDGATALNNISAGTTVATLSGQYAGSGDVKLLAFQRNGGAVAGAITYADASTGMEIGTTTSHTLALTTGDTQRLRIENNGDISFYDDTAAQGLFWDSSASALGIGTSSPSGKIDVSVASNQRIRFDDFGSKSRISSRNDAAAILPLLIDASDLILNSGSGGNVGIGVVPSAWGSFYSTINAGSAGNLAFFTGQTNAPVLNVGVNLYNDNTNFRYAATAAASFYQQYIGQHRWYNVASGGVGNIATPVQAMTLDASGNLAIGLTTGISSKLHVNTEMSIGADADNRAIVGYTPSRFYIGTRQGGVNYFDTVNVSAGSVGIGASGALTSTYLSKAFVYTAGGANFAIGGLSDTNNAVLGRFTSYNVANSNSGNEESGNFYGVTSIESIVVTTDSNAGDDSGGSLLFKTKPEAGALAERLRIDAAGNLQVGVAGTNNGRLDINTGSGTYIIDAINAAGGRYFAVDKGAPVDSFIVDSSGNLLVGVASGSHHRITKSVSEGTLVLQVDNLGAVAGSFWGTTSSAFSGANSGMKVGSTATGRSLNASGTLNASGADYAEYEHNNGLTISKGSVVGFKADGTLTLTFSEAVRFAIKSTDPSYVGGDTWGAPDQVGERPTQPEDDAEQSVIDQYETDLAAFEAALEAARQLVDRIAYSGKVPVNIQGATAGDYIIAVAADDGSIDGQAVADPDFTQYKLAVGRVNRILEDGRAEVAVIIH
jgi:hypothetical protein